MRIRTTVAALALTAVGILAGAGSAVADGPDFSSSATATVQTPFHTPVQLCDASSNGSGDVSVISDASGQCNSLSGSATVQGAW
ncbi:chaplin [Streptomyces sp. NPDC048157]|uniref:chaplin n=1 Tax=Streptomyces sp. NPDC048157 TaxID=3365503 RepID=UPI003714AE29